MYTLFIMVVLKTCITLESRFNSYSILFTRFVLKLVLPDKQPTYNLCTATVYVLQTKNNGLYEPFRRVGSISYQTSKLVKRGVNFARPVMFVTRPLQFTTLALRTSHDCTNSPFDFIAYTSHGVSY